MTKMKRMRMGRHLAWGWAVFAFPTLALVLVHCDDFTEAPASSSDSGTIDSGSPSALDSSSQTDAGSTDGAMPDTGVVDAGTKTLTCGNAKCNLSNNEFCCMYFNDVGSVRSGECILDKECDNPDSGTNHLVLVSECDDSTDCSTGQVCCHSQLSTIDGKCGSFPTVARCTAPASCKPCWEDGGLGKIACDPGRSGECGAATCMPENPLSAIIASGYCAKN